MPPRDRLAPVVLLAPFVPAWAIACGAPALPDSDPRPGDASTKPVLPSDGGKESERDPADSRAPSESPHPGGGGRDANADADANAATSRASDGGNLDGGPDAEARRAPLDVTVFTRTTGFRHPSIDAGRRAMQSMAPERTWNVTATEDPQAFAEGLGGSDVIVFLNTSGDVLGQDAQAAVEAWVRSGGGFVGVHAAADTEYDWPFYGELVGAWFLRHPAIQQATIEVEIPTHLSTQHLGRTWARIDEWYDFRQSPRDSATILLTLDESTYEGGAMGADHPIAWIREVDAGRAFYTGLGHTEECYGDAAFLAHLAGGIDWAGGR